METDSIGLHDLIEKIKEELYQTHSEEAPFFAIGEVELEVAFTVSKTKGAGITFQVLAAGMEKSTEKVHRIRILLEPIIAPEDLGLTLTELQRKIASGVLKRGDE